MNSKQFLTVLILIIGLLYAHFLVYKYNTKVDRLKVSLPLNIDLASVGDKLVCYDVSDSIYLSFDKTSSISADYELHLISKDTVSIYSTDNDTTYLANPKDIQKIIDLDNM